MPKMKTHSGTKKRFKVTGTGKVKYTKQNRRHILTKKSVKRKRHLRKAGTLAPMEAARVIKLLQA
ncbi:MAG: 50S ribosomal protein L35 [Candidatus Sumerlaeia bacterium]|nr:50S ribosomal protein L35 [Candidatus Sumerlaeia bacterium]